MSERNPLSIVHNALVDMALRWQPLTQLVRPGNVVAFAGDDRDPIKDQVQSADLPELRLIPIGMTPHLQRTSSSSTILKQFQWSLDTGDQRVTAALFPVEWELYRAMADWQTHLAGLKWAGKPFVVHSRPMNVREGESDTAVARNIRGWSSIWACEVLMVFTTSDLQDSSIV